MVNIKPHTLWGTCIHILIFLFHFILSSDETRRITSICPSFNFRAESKCGSHEVVAKPIFIDASSWPIMLQTIVKDSQVNLLFFCPCMWYTLILRIDVEACNLKENIDKIKALNSDERKSSNETTCVEIEVSFLYG